MLRDNKEFRERFQRWKEGKQVYENGRPIPQYQDGKNYGQQDTDDGIPFDESKRVRLTNAGYATGAVLSTNMLDSLADNAVKVGLPINLALGLAVKESTLGNPTDDRTAWDLSSAIRNGFNGVYPGTHQHINEYGDFVSSRELINWWKDQEDRRYGKTGRSVLEGGLEFYKNSPQKYNPGQKNYPQLVEKRAKELMKSPEIQQWMKDRVYNQQQQMKQRLKNGNAVYLRTPTM